jgi:hypothetical protein
MAGRPGPSGRRAVVICRGPVTGAGPGRSRSQTVQRRWGGSRAPPQAAAGRRTATSPAALEGRQATAHQDVPRTPTAVLRQRDTERGDVQPVDDVGGADRDRLPVGVGDPGVQAGVGQDPLVDEAAAPGRLPARRAGSPRSRHAPSRPTSGGQRPRGLQPRRGRWLGFPRRPQQQRRVTAELPATVRQVRCRPGAEQDHLAAPRPCQQVGLELVDDPLPPGVGQRLEQQRTVVQPGGTPRSQVT